MSDEHTGFDNLERIHEAVRRAQRAQAAVNELLPTRWTWTANETWEIHGKDCWIWMQARPSYCDRGSWLAHIELKPVPKGQRPPVHIDGADGWPRYYFDLDRAKAEVEAWLKKRQQWPEEVSQ